MFSKEKEEKHPSYGMLGFYRRHGGNKTKLFGSSIKHRDTIALVLKEGSVCRELNNDWFFGNKKLFEVEMSGEQFANLITNMNCSDGVPVTIRYTEGKGYLDFNDVPYKDRTDIHIEEFKKECSDAVKDTNKLLDLICEKFNKKTLNKADREEIQSLARSIQANIGMNMQYQMERFNEQVENIKTDAKAEIEMFWQNKMMQIANEAIRENKEKLLNTIESNDNVVEIE